MIVMKFGGTSVESAEAIRRVAGIVKGRLHRQPVVVVSAMGKTTNTLLAIAAEAAKGNEEEAMERLRSLEDFHRREAQAAIGVPEQSELQNVLDSHFRALGETVRGLSLIGELTPRSLDALASFGERISSEIVALAFRSAGIASTHLDARTLIVTDDHFTQAAPILSDTYARVSSAISQVERSHVVVTGGFIGATEEGVTTTLGRGGSDFTAALVGAAIGAEEIEIWTDVDGVLTCDPKLVPDAHPVKTISFDEAAELAYFGAKVLHPATVAPAKEKNIPVRILNSRRPDAPGTKIIKDTVTCSNVLKSLACKRGVTVVNIRSNRMLMAHGFLRRIFEVFDRHETAVDMVSTSEVSVSLTVDNDAHLPSICAELTPFTEVSVEKGQAILCAVGDNIRNTPGVAARVFNALRNVNVRMISQGASLLNLGFVIDTQDLPVAAAALHREFFTDLDPGVFD
jgi:aspartate kinase